MNQCFRPILRAQLRASALVAIVAPHLFAGDLIVDPAGGTGVYRDIQAAMDAARPGDRILVRPGSYQGFSVTKSITVLGLGQSPGDVQVAGIGFHPIAPYSGYFVRLSRMALSSLPTSQLVLGGNELAGGVLELDSLAIGGGVYLGAHEPGMVVCAANCRVQSDMGQGFRGATFMVAGPGAQLEVSRSEVTGAPGSLFPFAPAFAAIGVEDGASVRIAGSALTGGRGANAQDGAAALRVGNGQVPAIHADSILTGGNAGAGGAGGAAVRSDGAVFVGTAVLNGGAGTPGGGQLSGRGSVLRLSADEPALHLTVDRSVRGPVAAVAGSEVEWRLDTAGRPGLLLLSRRLSSSAGVLAPHVLLDAAASLLVIPSTTRVLVPALPGLAGIVLHAQGVTVDAAVTDLRFTTPVMLRIDG